MKNVGFDSDGLYFLDIREVIQIYKKTNASIKEIFLLRCG